MIAQLRFVAAFFLVLALPVRAATLSGATLPDTVTAGGQILALNGIGLRTLTIFEVPVYVAGLYLPQPDHDAQHILASAGPKVIALRFIHAGSKADIEKEYRLGEKNNCGDGGCAPSDAPEFERLIAAAPAVKPGDSSTYIFANGGATVLANGVQIFQTTNTDLAYRLLAGFIGPHPPSEGLKAALLGLKP